MIELCIGLGLIWLFNIIYTFIASGWYFGLWSILNMVIALIVTECCDVVTALVRHKKGESRKEEIIYLLGHNYSFVTAAILVLTLPVWTPIYVIILGSIFGTVVVKNFFGGFGKNIFNPAALARIFVVVSFQSQISASSSGLEAIASGTVTSLVNSSNNWISYSYEALLPNGYSLWQIFSGTYFGAAGETSTLLILLVGVVLAFRHDINWRTPVFYLGTVLVTALFVGLIFNVDNVFAYALIHLSLGGVAFGAVFMLTDPVTGPTSNFGKALIGVFAGFITMVIRYSSGSSYPEGVIFSIALANMISPVIDHFVIGKSTRRLPLKYGLVFGGVVLTMVLSMVIIGNSINWDNSKKTTYITNEETPTSLIIQNEEVNEILTYSLEEVM
jgi:Na+-translocating ferredoxin:NAD+ oxidoreductase RnfD subunit